ncbi:hypothetical protein ACFLSI_00190 [Bacteroidota bacterium]
MKNINIFIQGIFLILVLNSCKTIDTAADVIVYKDSIFIKTTDKLTINIQKGESFNHPSFVLWMEDTDGKYINTIFITKSYASGIFKHEMVGDTLWLKSGGQSYQPSALPYWTYKKGLIDEKYLVPTPEHPYLDGLTGATPDKDFKLMTGSKPNKDQYRILLEVNQPWDWNKFWTNNKYPDSPAYKHSAQPSIIYAVLINQEDSKYYLNPIGHGDPKGESGKLFTDINTLTTVKQIFESISIDIEKN